MTLAAIVRSMLGDPRIFGPNRRDAAKATLRLADAVDGDEMPSYALANASRTLVELVDWLKNGGSDE